MFKKESNERGKARNYIYETLNNVKKIKFKVTQRSVRERFDLLTTKFPQQNKEEEKASGISPETTKLNSFLEDICERDALVGSTRNSLGGKKLQQVDTDRKRAEEMRVQPLERGLGTDNAKKTTKKRN